MKNCNSEFPYFGASYPDAVCVDGYLYDMDSYDENERYTVGGGDPCPFCNAKEWLECVVGTQFETKKDALAWRSKIADKWKININRRNKKTSATLPKRLKR